MSLIVSSLTPPLPFLSLSFYLSSSTHVSKGSTCEKWNSVTCMDVEDPLDEMKVKIAEYWKFFSQEETKFKK